MKIFILEDDENRIEGFIAALVPQHDVTTAKWLSGPAGAYKKFQPPYDLLLLDHDLGGQQFVPSEEEETGFQFCRWLGAAPQEVPDVVIHSYNPDGAKAMQRLLAENGWTRSVLTPFSSQLLHWLRDLN